MIEFPNGQRHRFVATGTGWELESIYTVTSTLDANGSPSTHYVKFDKTSSAPDWKITDSQGREHWIRRFASGRINKVELKAFNAQTATYQFQYGSAIVKQPCRLSEDETRNSTITFLESLDVTEVPGAQAWSFAYNKSTSDCDDLSAVLTSATLPTKGRIGWEYTSFYFDDAPTAVAVKSRTVYDVSGTEIGRKLYNAGTEVKKISVETQVNHGNTSPPTWRTDVKNVEYRTWNWGPNVGLPIDTSVTDSGGRYLSSQTFDCDPDANTCPSAADRETYIKFEMDQQMTVHCPIMEPCQSERNRRVVSQKTVYRTDGDRFTQTDHSRFDGHGHYRQTVTKAGTASAFISRQTTTEYNRALGTYTVDSNGNRQSGGTIAVTAPWLLETYDETLETENGVTARRQYLFDANTGLLMRQRVLAGVSPGDTDLLTVLTRDGDGNLTREEHFGGDKSKPYSGDDNADLSAVTPAAHDQYTFRIDHGYSKGVRNTSGYVRNGTSMPFYSRNDTIDASTGLVKTSADAAGVTTTYVHDRLGRLTSVSPTGLASTTYEFSNADGTTTPASATVSTGIGDTATIATYEFDSIGRLRHEKRQRPDGSWSVRRTTYDSVGRHETVSEFETFTDNDYTPTEVTTFSGYDAYGRVGSVKAPDGKSTTFTYVGDRLTTRKQSVATSATAETDVSTIEEADGFGRLIAVTENAGTANAATTTYTYDRDHLVGVSMTDGSATQTRTFSYDRRGLLTSEVHPESNTTSYEYDSRGHVVKRVGAVATIVNEYDGAERIKTVTHEGVGVMKRFFYDRTNSGSDKSLGKVDYTERYNRASGAPDIVVTEKFTYARLGGLLSKRQTSLSTGETFSEQYTYDPMGSMTALTYPKCDVGCPSAATPTRTIVNTFAHGSPTQIDAYTSATNPITYHPNGMLASVQHTTATGEDGPVYTQTIADGMVRPNSIAVTNYCDDLRIDVSPQSRNVYENDPANLTVSATGATSYQWFVGSGESSIAINGQTSSNLTVPVTQDTMYWVRIGNGSCTVDSETAMVTVASCPAINATITAPSEMTSSMTAVASVPAITGATYSWNVTNGAIVSGGSTRSVTFKAGCSGTVSLSVTITTNCRSAAPAAAVTIQPFEAFLSGSTTISQGSSAQIEAMLTGVGPWDLTWSDGVVQTDVSNSPATRTVSPIGTTTYTLTSVKDGSNCSGLRSGNAKVTVIAPAPTGVIATAASATQVNVSWSFAGSMDSFDVYRAGVKIGSTTATSYVDSTATASTAYLYQVKAVKAGTSSSVSAPDLATTIIFIDDPVVPLVTEPATVHLTQLRQAVNAVRAAAGLAPSTFTDTITAGTIMRAVHLEELGTSLNQARALLGLSSVTFSRRPLVTTIISAVDVNELRGGVK